jgi:hypothetical protein
MNVPGFTAEMSLYKTDKRFHEAIGSAYASEGLYLAQRVFSPDDLRQGPPSFGGKLCWLPYQGWCLGANGLPYRCLKVRYIC